MSYGLPRAHEYEDEILLLKSRAEKAEASVANLMRAIDEHETEKLNNKNYDRADQELWIHIKI